ncbi:MAG: tetratricopeptide repeat protein [Clostridia bacterium]|nr:tetratricopeptide repeat protein [Clostridia bacterium]
MLYTGSLQRKVTNLSNISYNKALFCCNENRITEAIAALRESLEFDKKNIDARNLLGLCYYRLGRAADALIEWTISYKLKKNDNIAVDYIAELESAREANAMYDAITQYNEALSFANQGNTDMAILNLKKALEKNRELADAMNLLALCYIERGRESDAYRLSERVLKIDSTNPIALRYYQLLKPEKRLFFKAKPADSRPKGRKSGGFGYFIGGAAAAAVILGCMGLPDIARNYRNDYDRLQSDYNVLQNSMNAEIENKTSTISRLTEENENLRSRLYTVDNQELQQRVKLLTDIENYYNEGSVEEAAEKLIALSTQGFSQEVLNRYSALCKTVLPAAASEYFSAGKRASSNGNYASAKDYFNKAVKCTSEGDEVRYSAMYQLGRIADNEGDKTAALNYFKTVAEKHPVASVKNEAQKYIDEATANNTDE